MHDRIFADLSSFNPVFDAGAYSAAGHVAVAVKATEGTNYVSPNHRDYTVKAALHHLAVIHYHFARPDLGNTPANEAAHFIETVRPLAGGRDYLCLDLERATPAGWQHDPAWSREFDAELQRRSRFHTILYASRSVLASSDEWLTGDKRRVWDADWSNDPDFAPPGYRVFARQLSDGVIGPGPHEIAGVGRCDTNRLSWGAFLAITGQLPRPC